MTRTVTVAALQTAYGPDMTANISRTIDLVREAASKGAQVIQP
ncbi:MAG: N-carbamoylputrescine amidase, partial [Pseudomonadota bacterium]